MAHDGPGHAPLPPPEALTSDPRAMLAAAREAGAHGGALPTADQLAPVRAEAVCLLELDPVELLSGLDALLLAPRPDRALRVAERLGVVAVLLPEVQPLVGFHRTCPVHHKDLWDHTCQVIRLMTPDADLRWAALLHDAGKIATRRVAEGRVSFWRHEQLGAFLARGTTARLQMPAARAERIAFVVEHHGRVNAYDRSWSDRAVRRLRRELGPRLDDLLAFSRADFTTRRSDKRSRIAGALADLEARLEALAREEATPPALPSALGHALRDELGLEGRAIGQAMAWLTARVQDGALPRGADAEVYLEALRARQNG